MLNKLNQKERFSCPLRLEGSIKNIKMNFSKTHRGLSD
jgi:hypothetical protein